METRRAGVGVGVILLVFTLAGAFDPLDPRGNITLKWDVMKWTSDGYIALLTIINYQQYRHIDLPGWTLGWTWPNREIIWSMLGAQATMQGDCSMFRSVIPHSCLRKPSVVDLLPDVPPDLRVSNCCRHGVLSSPVQDPENSIASLQLTVGQAANSSEKIQPPVRFTIGAPGPGYACSPPVWVNASLFLSADGRRRTQALRTWNVTCTYSQAVAQKAPTCCVSYSAFYNPTIIPCQSCACECSYNLTRPAPNAQPMCRQLSSAYMRSPGFSTLDPRDPPELYCSLDMCPVKLHWHIKTNYYDYWRAKLTITNRSILKNYTQWNVVVQHPNLRNLTTAFSFNYTGISTGKKNDTGMFWGIKYYNDMLLTAGPDGNVQSEFLFGKTPGFTMEKGWAFPRKVYFNGDECVLPSPHTFPSLPSSASITSLSSGQILLFYLASVFLLLSLETCNETI